MITTEIAKPTITQAPPTLALSGGRRLAMVAIAYVPFLNLLAIVTLAILPFTFGWPKWTLLAALAWLMLVPPIVVRVASFVGPLPSGDIRTTSAAFLRWWFMAQWQVIYNRLPLIEEVIRLVPGLYSAWLRMWGSRIGRFVYWTPGLRILDRQMIEIGSGVVFGAGVRINPHVIMPDDGGELVLRHGTVRVGDEALVGGYSILFAGCWIGAREATPGKRDHRPFTGWKDGRRVLPNENSNGEQER